jgi:glycosyltransferase involved in cell wall biosynthesis
MLRDLELIAIRDAACVLVRTPHAKAVLAARAGVLPDRLPVQIVTNGRDEAAFTPGTPEERRATRARLGIAPDALVIAYAGTVGYRHHTDRVAAFSAAVRKVAPDAHLLVLTRSPDEARQLLFGHAPELAGHCTFVKAAADEVPRYLAAADVGTSFIRASFSTQGVAPLKTAEYLLCGLPVVGTAEVGNNHAALAAGVFHDDGELPELADWLLNTVRPSRESLRVQARAVGVAEYSIARAVSDYRQAMTAVADGLRESRSGDRVPG